MPPIESLAAPPSNPASHLLENAVRFCRVLRVLGMDVGPDRVMDFVRALDVIDLANKLDFYHAARALLVSRREEMALFDAAFEMFWWSRDSRSNRQSLKVSGTLPRQARPVVLPPTIHAQDQQGSPPGQPENQPPPVIEATATYSARAVLRHKDFAELSPDELEEVKGLINRFVWNLGERRTRRHRPGGDGRVDIRRSIRRNLAYGGEIVRWAYRQPYFKPRPLVLIADISGSMDSYTRLLMRFCFSVARSLRQPVEAFVFATELTRITRQLHTRDVDAALSGVSRAVSDWSGGTRIGEALHTFNRVWGQRVLGQGAVAILISDGMDRGDSDLLAREMARLRRTAYRLIWLNPLLGSPGYEPLTYGMQAALPHVHDFLPVRNLASLESLADHLASLGQRAGERRMDYARRAF